MFATEQQTEENPKSLADIIREQTDDGRLVVRFLIDVMQGKVDDSKPCHRLDAARQLLNLGFDGAQTVIQSVSQSAGVRAPSSTPSKSRFDQGIADIIKLETSDGKDAVRFLVDVMQGNLQDFKPHHRLAAAKELLRQGFDNTPGHSAADEYEYEDHDEPSGYVDPRTPEQRDPNNPNYVTPSGRLRNKEDDPFDFDNYDREQFWRDGWGGRALRHIYGSKEAVKVARKAVSEHRRKTIFDESHIPDRDYSPIDNPEDDPYGKGHYGYNALCMAYGDNQAIRVANKAVAEYKKRKAELSGGESENEGPPPDHWSLDRTGNRSTETDEPSENPDPGQSKAHKLSDAKDPPRKRPVKIFLGPPDDSPRQCRDPGDFQSAIDSIWSTGIFADQ